MKRLNTMNLYKIQSNLLCTRAILPLFGFRFLKCCLMPSVWPRLANVVLSLGILNLTWPVGFNSFDVRHFFSCCCITSENIYLGEFKRHYRRAVHIYLQASSLLCSVIAYALHFVTLCVASQFQHFHLVFLLLPVFRTFFSPLIFCEAYPTPHSF